MSDNKSDFLTSLFRRATDILFVANPKGTSMGLLFGVVVEMMTHIFEPLFKRQQIVDFTKIKTLYYICFGIFLFNLPLMLRRPRLDPQIEIALAAIKKAKREGNISAAHVRLRYVNLIDKVIAQIELNREMTERVRSMQRVSGGDGPLQD